VTISDIDLFQKGADFQDPLSNIFGTSHTKPIKFQKPKMILLSEQKKLNPVDFTAKTQLRSPHSKPDLGYHLIRD